MNIAKDVQIKRAIAPAAAGATTLNGVTIDTQGAESIGFAVILGDGVITGTVQAKVQEGAASDASDMADVSGCAGAVVTSDGTNTDNKLLILEAVKVTKRYARVVLVRAVANHVVEGGVALLHGYHRLPVTQPDAVDTTVANG